MDKGELFFQSSSVYLNYFFFFFSLSAMKLKLLLKIKSSIKKMYST